MALTPTQKEFIQELQGTTAINGRYSSLGCVNAGSGTRRGVMSFVFQAYDTLQGDSVAIKFIDPECSHEPYFSECFNREAQILKNLLGKKRCLQLVDNLDDYDWHVRTSSGAPVTFKCRFFVTEWLEEDIDDYMFKQETFDPIEKLVIFRKVLLAVEAIHRENLFHRDIKIDNIRMKNIDGEQVVVLIDLGMAAKTDEPPIRSGYMEPVGASGYSGVESFCGFAGDRMVTQSGDKYALGALLFGLFNLKEFIYERDRNTDFRTVRRYMQSFLMSETDAVVKHNIWKHRITAFRNHSDSPDIYSDGNSIPPSIHLLIVGLYQSLTMLDFNKRTISLHECRNKVDSAIRALGNQKREQVIIDRRRKLRDVRKKKIDEKQARLDSYADSSKGLHHAK